jgi:hypothetical protein
MRLLLSNNRYVEHSANKNRMETWGTQQPAVHTGGEPQIIIPISEMMITVLNVCALAVGPIPVSTPHSHRVLRAYHATVLTVMGHLFLTGLLGRYAHMWASPAPASYTQWCPVVSPAGTVSQN